ncbi:uncharacterized protein LOC130756663 [Actinidia eriantha]|uniref:uncharacterized protein LOC130756663 n=1 Tax=Actinidia eriantha TaxID=165200 RepID=UPI002587AB43|nr:uncharacterized protein LOC130756663 [Actinidia eriantha]
MEIMHIVDFDIGESWRFDETKRRLLDHARASGLKLAVEEVELHNLESEIAKMKRKGGSGEWFSFNCMVGLPHMGRVRSRSHVMEFLKVAKSILVHLCTFQNHLGEARTAMECLFVDPPVYSLGWIQKWKEREEFCYFELSCELEKWKVSKESLMEAKEMVREGVSPYGGMVEDETNNEVVLEWRGIKLLKVSFWRKS